MMVKLCLGSLEEKVVRGLSFFKRPCCLVYIVLWVSVSDCCIYIYMVQMMDYLAVRKYAPVDGIIITGRKYLTCSKAASDELIN